jgi:hypothetical protein
MEIRQIKKEIDIWPASYLNRCKCRKYREILFKFKAHQDLLFVHISDHPTWRLLSSDLFRITFWRNLIRWNMKRYFWPYVVLVIRRQWCGLSIYCFLKWTWYVDFCGNGDSTCRHCVIITQKRKNKRTMRRYITSIYIVNILVFNMQR